MRCASSSSHFAPSSPARPSARINAGRLSPCPTRVTRMTQKVRKTIKFRCVKGLPSDSTCGSDSAAASEITPRMPVQPITRSVRAGGVSSFWPSSRRRMK